MRLYLTLFYLIFAPIASIAQSNEQWIFSLEQASKMSPDSVFFLSLRDQKIKRIPQEIWKYKNLKKLDLSLNNIRKFPEEIAFLSNLQELNFAYNPLKSISKGICKLTSLKTLNLLDTRIRKLPEEIKFLKNLSVLNLNGSGIKELPPSFFELTNLKELYLGNKKDDFSNFSKETQITIRSSLPNCAVHF